MGRPCGAARVAMGIGGGNQAGQGVRRTGEFHVRMITCVMIMPANRVRVLSWGRHRPVPSPCETCSVLLCNHDNNMGVIETVPHLIRSLPQ
jgi:hypothetical protein